MCGRFALNTLSQQLAIHFGLKLPSVVARYNIAPTQYAIALANNPQANNRPEFSQLFWGLVPFWAKEKIGAARMINARADTVAEKPAFRAAFRHRRCLIPASGFYEWRREGKSKTPFYFSPASEQDTLAFAGIWEEWAHGEEILHSFAILTTEANAVMRPVHDRMPVIVAEPSWERWLDPQLQKRSDLQDLLCPCPDDFLTLRQVGTYVNKASNEGPQCLEEAV